jgi:hypothetical protein
LSGSETKTVTGGHGEETQSSEGWQGASVGAVSAKMLLVFVLARKRRLDLATVRAVAERRPPECSGVNEKTRSLPFQDDGCWVWGVSTQKGTRADIRKAIPKRRSPEVLLRRMFAPAWARFDFGIRQRR